MSRPSTRFWFESVIVCAVLATGCSNDKPCFPSSLGKQYKVTVEEVWDVNSQFPGGRQSPRPCPRDFDLFPGSSFVVRVDSFNLGSGGCECGGGKTTQGPEGWTWDQSAMGRECQTDFFVGGTKASKDACTGLVEIDIHTHSLPAGPSIPGQAPLAYASRGFGARSFDGKPAMCPSDASTCGDTFVVQIEEL